MSSLCFTVNLKSGFFHTVYPMPSRSQSTLESNQSIS